MKLNSCALICAWYPTILSDCIWSSQLILRLLCIIKGLKKSAVLGLHQCRSSLWEYPAGAFVISIFGVRDIPSHARNNIHLDANCHVTGAGTRNAGVASGKGMHACWVIVAQTLLESARRNKYRAVMGNGILLPSQATRISTRAPERKPRPIIGDMPVASIG